MRYLLALLPVALLAAACGGGGSTATTSTEPTTAAAPTTTAAAPATTAKPALHVSFTADSHHPVIGQTWSYEVRVTDPSGKPVACRIHLQFLFSGAPVGELGTHQLKTGVWKETIPATGPDAFPLAAVGQPLVVRTLATAPGYTTGKALWPITVKKQ